MNVTHKEINALIIQLGRNLVGQYIKKSLYNQFNELISLLEAYPLGNKSKYKKQKRLEAILIELFQIEDSLHKNLKSSKEIQQSYLNLYHKLINIFLWLGEQR